MYAKTFTFAPLEEVVFRTAGLPILERPCVREHQMLKFVSSMYSLMSHLSLMSQSHVQYMSHQ